MQTDSLEPATQITAAAPTLALRLGTRNSELALKQTTMAKALLAHNHPRMDWSVVSMTTTGDEILNAPLHQIGSKALFTKELEVALHENRVDLVVHSYKDVPTTLPAGMTIGAVCRREDPRDVVVLSQQSMEKGYRRLEDLPEGSQIGTSSVRRIAQLSKWLPRLVFKDIVSRNMCVWGGGSDGLTCERREETSILGFGNWTISKVHTQPLSWHTLECIGWVGMIASRRSWTRFLKMVPTSILLPLL